MIYPPFLEPGPTDFERSSAPVLAYRPGPHWRIATFHEDMDDGERRWTSDGWTFAADYFTHWTHLEEPTDA